MFKLFNRAKIKTRHHHPHARSAHHYLRPVHQPPINIVFRPFPTLIRPTNPINASLFFFSFCDSPRLALTSPKNTDTGFVIKSAFHRIVE